MNRKTAKKHSGFTLVELIVVVAIMGILGGVGIPAYNGYIKKTRMGVDRKTVGDLIYAAELANYANPLELSEGEQALIFLTDKGTVAIGNGYPDCIVRSVGALKNLTLKAKWDGSVDGPTVSAMRNSLHDADAGLNYTYDSGDKKDQIAYTDTDGNPAGVPYTKKAAELWDLVKQVAADQSVGDALQGRTAGQFMALAAERTLEAMQTTSGSGGGTKMAELFAKTNDPKPVQVSVGSGENAHYDTQYVDDPFIISNYIMQEHPEDGTHANAAAGMAAGMAKNRAFVEYLRTTGTVSEDVLSQLGDVGSLMGDEIVNHCVVENTVPGSHNFDEETNNAIIAAAQGYTAPKFHYGESEEKVSQAYIDGMIYYALMHNVDRISKPQGDNPPQYNPADPDYMDNVGNYVKVAGNVFSDPGTFNAVTTEMNSENSFIGEATSIVNIAVQKIGGRLICTVNPAAADPRDTWDSGASTEVIPTEEHMPDTTKTSIEGDQIILRDADGNKMTEIVSKNDEDGNGSITIKSKKNNQGGLMDVLGWEKAEITSCKIDGVSVQGVVTDNGGTKYSVELEGGRDVEVFQPSHKKIINLIGPNDQKTEDDRGDYKINLELTVKGPDGNEKVLGPIDYWFIK